MKRYTLLLLASAILSPAWAGPQQADFIVPISDNRIADTGLKSAGVDKCLLVTSTTPALATDRNANTFTAGLIYWIVRPATGTVNSLFLELRDSATANTSSTRLIPWVAAVANGAAVQADQTMWFDPPIAFANGLSVNLLPAGASPATGADFAIGIRHRQE